MTTDPTLLQDAAAFGFSVGDIAKLAGALVLGALLGWDIRVRNALPSARMRQGALAHRHLPLGARRDAARA